MITNITLQNFKCFRELEVNPKLITVFIGPNGAGKSSVLQALLLLKQSAESSRPVYQGKFIDLRGETDVIPNFLKGPAPFSVNFRVSGLQAPSSEHLLTLEKLRFVSAARGLARPTYALGDSYVEYITSLQGLGVQEEQLATNLVYARLSEERLSNLLHQVTGTGLRAETVPSRAVEVKSLTPSGAVNMVAEGFGANALIQLFHQLITADKGATVLIEEPEIHLHPKAQAELAEVLADTAKADGKQIIMTTHSEYVAGRLLTLVAENRLSTDDLAIYHFEKNEKGECFASEIEVTEHGQTKGGLTGFHEATRDEMRRYVDGLRSQA